MASVKKKVPKKRINVSLPDSTVLYLQHIALRDQVPPATKAAELIEKALEMEEDAYLSAIGDARASEDVAYLPMTDESWGL